MAGARRNLSVFCSRNDDHRDPLRSVPSRLHCGFLAALLVGHPPTRTSRCDGDHTCNFMTRSGGLSASYCFTLTQYHASARTSTTLSASPPSNLIRPHWHWPHPPRARLAPPPPSHVTLDHHHVIAILTHVPPLGSESARELPPALVTWNDADISEYRAVRGLQRTAHSVPRAERSNRIPASYRV
eukprot:2742752-Rhodomonas_salina.1